MRRSDALFMAVNIVLIVVSVALLIALFSGYGTPNNLCPGVFR